MDKSGYLGLLQVVLRLVVAVKFLSSSVIVMVVVWYGSVTYWCRYYYVGVIVISATSG